MKPAREGGHACALQHRRQLGPRDRRAGERGRLRGDRGLDRPRVQVVQLQQEPIGCTTSMSYGAHASCAK